MIPRQCSAALKTPGYIDVLVYDATTHRKVLHARSYDLDAGWYEVVSRDTSGRMCKTPSGDIAVERIYGNFYVKHRKTDETLYPVVGS